jgi:hypothetical protein
MRFNERNVLEMVEANFTFNTRKVRKGFHGHQIFLIKLYILIGLKMKLNEILFCFFVLYGIKFYIFGQLLLNNWSSFLLRLIFPDKNVMDEVVFIQIRHRLRHFLQIQAYLCRFIPVYDTTYRFI